LGQSTGGPFTQHAVFPHGHKVFDLLLFKELEQIWAGKAAIETDPDPGKREGQAKFRDQPFE